MASQGSASRAVVTGGMLDSFKWIVILQSTKIGYVSLNTSVCAKHPNQKWTSRQPLRLFGIHGVEQGILQRSLRLADDVHNIAKRSKKALLLRGTESVLILKA
eukprot:1670326-Amphidinium_carterae.1